MSENLLVHKYQQWLADAQLAQAQAEVERDIARQRVAQLEEQVRDLTEQSEQTLEALPLEE